MNNLVAIVGRPNVGKSSLFNRIVGKRVSIVDDVAGVTRDRIYQPVRWQGKSFKLIDTGGIEMEEKPFQEQIKIQAKIAIEEANQIIFVIDGKAGLTFDDEFIMKLLNRSNKRIVVVANKLEDAELDFGLYSLGAEKIFPISALHGKGIGDLLDDITSYIPKESKTNSDEIKLSLIGRPNAGKSSLLNLLSNEERSIVSEVPGTTRDSVDALIVNNGQKFRVIDTAGISRKSKLIESVDHYALMRAMDSLEDSDISLLLIDATKKISNFDSRIVGYAYENKKPIILVINKWDLVKKETNTMLNYENDLRKRFHFIPWAQIVFISAKTGEKMTRLFENIQSVMKNLHLRISTNVLNSFISEIQVINPANSFNGGRANISFMKQVEASIPTFLLFINNKKYLHFSYYRYIENQFREYFGFSGVPINLLFRNKKK